MHHTDKLKVVTIIGTRPEIIRLSLILPKLDTFFDHTLIHTGQNYDYELNEIFFTDLNLKRPDISLKCADEGPAKTIANVICEVDAVLDNLKPDAVLILGDTNSSLAAIPTKRRKIPIFHMEAGNRCYDLNVPEEINRKVVDHLADINLPYSQLARDCLIREGIDPTKIIVTGSPLQEVLNYHQEKIGKSEVLTRFDLCEHNYFVVSLHREENVDCSKKLARIVGLLNTMAAHYKLPIIVSLHPRTRKRLQLLSVEMDEKIIFTKPLSFTDYIKIQLCAKVVISDSGTITEEASILNFPAINLRDSHERPEGMEEGAVILSPAYFNYVKTAIDILNGQSRGAHRNIDIVNDYAAANTSDKIVRIILSHIDVINRTVWRK